MYTLSCSKCITTHHDEPNKVPQQANSWHRQTLRPVNMQLVGASELVTGDEFTVTFFTFVTSSPCDDFTLWRLHCDELYDWCLLYSTLAVGVPCPSVAVVCWWCTHANQFWDDFFHYYFMSHFKAEMHRILWRLGLRPRPRWGSLHLQRSPRPSGFKWLYF